MIVYLIAQGGWPKRRNHGILVAELRRYQPQLKRIGLLVALRYINRNHTLEQAGTPTTATGVTNQGSIENRIIVWE